MKEKIHKDFCKNIQNAVHVWFLMQHIGETIKTNIHLAFRKLFYIVHVTIELQNDF